MLASYLCVKFVKGRRAAIFSPMFCYLIEVSGMGIEDTGDVVIPKAKLTVVPATVTSQSYLQWYLPVG